jgi:hypothetical protein
LAKNRAGHGHCLLHREMMALTKGAYQMRTNFRMADIHPEPKSPTDLVLVGFQAKGVAQMSSLQVCILGLILAWTPSLIFLACIFYGGHRHRRSLKTNQISRRAHTHLSPT